MRVSLVALVSVPLAIPLLACLATPAPEGDLVGDYVVEGVLEANECGAAVPANDTITLRVQIRRDGDLASWRTPAGGVVRGTHSDGDYAFSVASTIPLFEGDPEVGTAGCSLDQIERIEVGAMVVSEDAGVVDAGEVDAGEVDAGEVDAGEVDAGEVGDAGVPEAGQDADAAVATTTSFSGRSILRYRPSAGSSCAPALAIYGGPFDELPCEVRYRLQSSPSEPLFE
jgi:hypothetical protein